MINESLVFIDTPQTNQEEVLDFLANTLFDLDYISDKEAYLKAVLDREKDLPTSVGFSVAMPHLREQCVNKPFVAVMKLSEPFVWDVRNNESVQLVFAIGVPVENEDNLHLKYISSISKKLIDDDFRNGLLNSKNSNEAYKLLENIGG